VKDRGDAPVHFADVALESLHGGGLVEVPGGPVVDERLDVPVHLGGSPEEPAARGVVVHRRGEVVDEEQGRQPLRVAQQGLEGRGSGRLVGSCEGHESPIGRVPGKVSGESGAVLGLGQPDSP
jgi:hypothetical protein